MRVNRSLIAATAVGLTLTLGSCGSSGADGAATSGDGLTKVVVSYGAISPFALFPLALDRGIFEEHGLDVELAPGGNAASAISSLINGDVNAVPGGFSVPVLAAAEGLPVVIASQLDADNSEAELGPQYGTLVADKSDIRTWSDLEGKTVAAHSINCCWEFWTREAVESDGGDSSRVKFLQIPFPNQLQALQAGQVDAVTTLQPFLTIGRQSGLRTLGDPVEIAFGSSQGGGAAVTMAQSFIDEHPGVLEAWQASMAEAVEYANSHPDEMRAIIQRETGMEMGLLAKMPLPNWRAEVDPKILEDEIEFTVKYGVVDSDDAPTVEEILAPGAAG